MSFRILFIIVTLYTFQALSSELTVYRWVDKNNVVHFSQYQPVGDDYTEFLISNQSKITSRADQAKTVIDKNAQQNLESDAPPTIDATKKCKEARENVSMLTAFDKVQYTDEDGTKQVLTAKEKQQQLEINEKRTEVYCTPEKAK
jgi:hypothetical protein